MDSPLEQAILKSMSASFLQQLIGDQQRLYNEARHYAFSTALWGKWEAEFVYPTARRAIFEGKTRDLAERLDIPHENRLHQGGNCYYVFLSLGGIELTIHHVDRPKRFVRPAISRRQNAAVNKLVLQPHFPELLLEPMPDLSASPINAHLLHGLISEQGEEGVTHQSPFLTLALPHPDKDRYVAVWDAREIMQKLAIRAEAEAGQTVVVDENANDQDFKIRIRGDAARNVDAGRHGQSLPTGSDKE